MYQEAVSGLEAQLALAAKYAPALRAAGVKALYLEGIHMELLPQQGETELPPPPPPEPKGRDPGAYGLPPGTKMPSLRGRRG